MTKVAFVTNIITPFRKTFFEKLCADTRFEWTIAYGLKPRQDGRPVCNETIEIPYRNLENVEKEIGPYTIRMQPKAWEIVREFQPDIMILLGIAGNVTTWLLLLWGKLTRRKIVMWTCGWEKQDTRSVFFHLKRTMLRLFFSFADHHLVYGTKAKAYLQDLGVAEERITICYNGIDVGPLQQKEQDSRAAARMLRDIAGEKKVFFYAGAMMPEKKVHLLVEAFAKLARGRSDVVLWVVGGGPELPALTRLAEEMGIGDACHFWGRIDRPEPFYAASDFFVLPGAGGVALNEAMFWGLPCICAEADGTEDDLVVDGVNGKRFTAGNPVSLAAAMEECLYLDEDEKERWRKVSRDLIVTRSNVDMMVRTFGSALQRMVGGGAG